ncbi:Gp37 family protein [Bilophila wadsworthia]|uniref:Gp37 family protein n=1 Tax=Bilophila wadsworthia TaxID=35833 RepID=UPI00242B36C6|nr:Gp37 family protein [Bilophila wadsworthia]
MATTNEILAAVRERLAILPLAAELWPEHHEKYRLNHPVGAALVGYAGARFDNARDVGVCVQDRDMIIPVILCFRQLNGANGAIDMLDRVRTLLLGFAPPDCGKILLQAEKFAGEEDRVWWYQLDVACRTIAVEDAEEEDGPVLTQLNYEEQL